MQKGKIVNIQRYKYEKLIGELWEYPDSYEYNIVPDYEEKFHFTRTECIQMGDCFANIVKSGSLYELISIIFFKDSWTIREILAFLSQHKIELFPSTSNSIEILNVSEIIDAKKFKNQPIVLSKIGVNNLQIDKGELDEVTELYSQYDKINNTGLATKVTDINQD